MTHHDGSNGGTVAIVQGRGRNRWRKKERTEKKRRRENQK